MTLAEILTFVTVLIAWWLLLRGEIGWSLVFGFLSVVMALTSYYQQI